MLLGRTERQLKMLLLYGAMPGFLYGFLLRVSMMAPRVSKVLGPMSVSFLFLIPFAMGFLSVFLVERKERQPYYVWLLLPWVPVFAGGIAAGLLFIEGLICIAMYLPFALLLGSLGGLLAALMVRVYRSVRGGNAITASVLLLPLLVGPWEGRVLRNTQIPTTERSVDIHAPASIVWKNIERVPAIRAEELPDSWTRRIGFPDPIEATLSFEGVGAVRHATFAGNVLFIETVDAWEPDKHLAFSIHAESAPALDEHVRVGGEYFDVLRGDYRIEPLPDGWVRLHLSSQQRLTTDFNWYARLWTNAAMADLQSRILAVIKQRCERANAN
jgi:hypothetical protein